MSKNFTDWANAFMVCNEFAVAYKRENENSVLKYGETAEGDLHAYVYDPDQDKTLDATLAQFEIHGPQYQDDWFIGDDHPHVDELAEFDSIVAFVREFGGTNVLTAEEKEEL